ncbi:hypothetical protein rosag_20960 [Roseisolibacter agri]|uniref:Uncharacterized protein n=1 Tax=Roseisolibacter agri TaxID=2014610 RepID=A0AA37QGX5_9BACT|nr:hypothetical protein rosag_20960 [Roseisolibacter agri]
MVRRFQFAGAMVRAARMGVMAGARKVTSPIMVHSWWWAGADPRAQSPARCGTPQNCYYRTRCGTTLARR